LSRTLATTSARNAAKTRFSGPRNCFFISKKK
jgi:hypothetical protein